jgi:hypothetical protein
LFLNLLINRMRKLYLTFHRNNYYICEDIVKNSCLLYYLTQVITPKNNMYFIDMTNTPLKEETIKWFSNSNVNMYSNDILLDSMNAFDYLYCKKFFLACAEKYTTELALCIPQKCKTRYEFLNETEEFFNKKFKRVLDISDIEKIFGEQFWKNPNFILLKSFIKMNDEYGEYGKYTEKEKLKLLEGVKSILQTDEIMEEETE